MLDVYAHTNFRRHGARGAKRMFTPRVSKEDVNNAMERRSGSALVELVYGGTRLRCVIAGVQAWASRGYFGNRELFQPGREG